MSSSPFAPTSHSDLSNLDLVSNADNSICWVGFACYNRFGKYGKVQNYIHRLDHSCAATFRVRFVHFVRSGYSSTGQADVPLLLY